MNYQDIDFLQEHELAVAMTGDLDAELRQHFAHEGIQEDLTLVNWHPSFGSNRMSFVLDRALLPDEDERVLDGNVSNCLLKRLR